MSDLPPLPRHQHLFPAADAERFYSKSAGKPYRPSNGTEGDYFEDRFCRRCVKDSGFDPMTGDGQGCEILCNVMGFDIKDPEYPKEWVYGPDGQPRCTAYEASDD